MCVCYHLKTPCYTGGCPPFCRLGVSYTKLASKPCNPITVRAFFFPLSEPFCYRPHCALGSYFLLMSIVTIWPLPAFLTLSFLLYYLFPLRPIHNEQQTLSEHPMPSSPYLSVSVVTSHLYSSFTHFCLAKSSSQGMRAFMPLPCPPSPKFGWVTSLKHLFKLPY